MSHNPMMPKMLPGLRLTNNGNTIEVVGPIHWNPQNPPTPPRRSRPCSRWSSPR